MSRQSIIDQINKKANKRSSQRDKSHLSYRRATLEFLQNINNIAGTTTDRDVFVREAKRTITNYDRHVRNCLGGNCEIEYVMQGRDSFPSDVEWDPSDFKLLSVRISYYNTEEQRACQEEVSLDDLFLDILGA